MKLAFYKGPASGFWKTVGHLGICLWTRSKYSHCEVVFGEETPSATYLCASASSRDGGVRFKFINLHSGHWDIVDLAQHTELQEQEALRWFYRHEGEKYDYVGLLFFVIPIKLEAKTRWFCSEAAARALGLPKWWKFTPKLLFNTMETASVD